LAVRAGASD